MIAAFRKQFIAIAMSAMTFAFVTMLLLINMFNYAMTMDELKTTLKRISDSGGVMAAAHAGEGNGTQMRLPWRNPGAAYQGLYFTAVIDPDGERISVSTKQIDDLDGETAQAYARLAQDSGREYGYAGPFLYHVSRKKNGFVRISFINWQSQRTSLITFGISSASMGILGLITTFVIVWCLSKKAVKPLMISADKQKQFITDASHELKTPLSVIAVNMDVLAMDLGENEWITSTQQQVRSLRNLVEQLVAVARMEETQAQCEKENFCLSDTLRDAAAPFEAVAASMGKSFALDVQPGVFMRGNEELIRRLIGILCDNAVKYADAPGDIRVCLTARGRACELSVSNRYHPSDPNADLSRMFDRFYRADASRSRDRQGGSFGIGLSIAEKIVTGHQGKIQVCMKNRDTILFRVQLPR